MEMPVRSSNNAPLPSSTPITATSSTAVPGCWREACEQIAKDDVEAWAVLKPYLPTSSNMYDTIAEEVSRNVTEAQKLREENHPRSEKAKKWLESGVQLIQKFSSTISAVAALNPYASIAWSAVSATLPILLVSKTENEAAMDGVQKIMCLIYVYRTREASFSRQKLREQAAILPSKLRELYTKILLYEAAILQHRGKKKIGRIFDDITNHGHWKKQNDELSRLDSEFTTIWESELRHREDQARDEEADWRCEQRMRIEDSRNLEILSLFDTNYHTIKKTKERKGTRVDGTCGWFLRHPQYSKWQADENAAILWVSAGPGSGKSVLSLFLFDARENLLKTRASDQPVFCYYFFSTEFQNNNDAATCIRALIHQILLQDPDQSQDIEISLRGRNREQAVNEYDTLWPIFTDLVSASRIGDRQVICVIDAVDECKPNPSERQLGTREAFIKSLVSLFSRSDKSKLRLKLIITSRPYDSIEGALVSSVERLEILRLRGEDESKEIQREISQVVRVRVKALARKKRLTKNYRDRLIEALNSYKSRTYLWLHLVLDYIDKKVLHRSSRIEELVDELPASVEAAYEEILNSSTDRDRARLLLGIVSAAREPLTPVEAWVALELNSRTIECYSDLFPARTDAIESLVTSLCGLILCVVDGKVTFIHQTAREYLFSGRERVASENLKTEISGPKSEPLSWRGSLRILDCHIQMTKVCLMRLSLEAATQSESDNSTDSSKALCDRDIGVYSRKGDPDSAQPVATSSTSSPLDVALSISSESSSSEDAASSLSITNHLLRYALQNWVRHLGVISSPLYRLYLNSPKSYILSKLEKFDDLLGLILDKILPFLDIQRCPNSGEYTVSHDWAVEFPSAINRAAALNLQVVLEFAQRRGIDYSTYSEHGVYPLLVAVARNNSSCVDFLIQAGAPVNVKNSAWQARCLISPENKLKRCGHNTGITALHLALAHRNEEFVGRLDRHGANVGIVDDLGNNALHYAAQYRRPTMHVPVFDTDGKRICDDPNEAGDMPISLAIKFGNWGWVKYLIEEGVKLPPRREEDESLVEQATKIRHLSLGPLMATIASYAPYRNSYGNLRVVEELESCHSIFGTLAGRPDVDLTYKNSKGQTILDVQREIDERYSQVSEIIRELGKLEDRVRAAYNELGIGPD